MLNTRMSSPLPQVLGLEQIRRARASTITLQITIKAYQTQPARLAYVESSTGALRSYTVPTGRLMFQPVTG